MGLGELKAKYEYEARLIKEVKRREILYKPFYRDDKHNAEKDNQWQEIANSLGESAPTLKSRWKNLLDRYQKMSRRFKETNLSDSRSSSNPSKWIHFEGMSFLSGLDLDEAPTNNQISTPVSDLSATTSCFYIPNIDRLDKDVPFDSHIIEDSSGTDLDLSSFDKLDDSIVEDYTLPRKLLPEPIAQQRSEPVRTTANNSQPGPMISTNSQSPSTVSRKRKRPENDQTDIEILLNKLTCIVDNATNSQSPAVLGTHKFFASLADKVLAAKLRPEIQMQLERETLDFVYTKLRNIQVTEASKLFQ